MSTANTPQRPPAERPRPRQGGPGGGAPRAPRKPPVQVRTRAARQYATIHRIDPWSVLKYSLIINMALLLITMVAVAMVWAYVQQTGTIEWVQETLAKFQFVFALNAGNIAKAIFLFGLQLALLSSGINVFVAFFYNLIADLLGGFRIELASDD